MKGKFTCWLLIVMLFFTLLPVPVSANIVVRSDTQQTSNSISLEKAIQNVKQNFTIPSSLTEFTSSFESYGERQRWRLLWSSENDADDNFEAQVDALSGEIVHMYRWSGSNNSYSKTPSLSVLEARKIGQDLLARLLPGKLSSLTLQDDSSLIPLGAYESPRYTMTWKRTNQGINVAMDYVRMEIDMQTGEVSSYNLNWTDKTFPSSANIVTEDQAHQTFISREILQLQYIKPQIRNQQSQPQLIYGIRHPSNGMIDAVTGQPLALGGYYYSSYNAGAGNSMKIANYESSADSMVELSPEELKEINNSAQFISQAKAIELVKKWLPISEDMLLDSASLEKDWRDNETRLWSLSWRNNTSEEGYHSYVWAQLDAATGELLSFNLNLPPQKEISKADIIDQNSARAAAEKFIRSIQPQRWSEIKPDEMNSQIRPMDLNPPTWSFNYLRLVNGVIYPNNGIEISIDSSSGQVSSYRFNWSKGKFPSRNSAITSQKANDIFLQTAPLTLYYTMVPNSQGIEELKLVYQPEAKEGFAMIDALTGTALDQEGKAITNKPRPYVFNDINGHFGEKEIKLLGQAGILGEYNPAFNPDENIKLVDLLRAMLSAKDGVYSVQGMDDKEIIKRCQNYNWIEKNTPINGNVSREQLAQLMIRFLNIDFLSQAEGIYLLSYQDAAQMSPRLKAYAALCWGLGIIKADGKTFNPQHAISRAEAAVALANTLSIKTRP